MIFLNNSTSKYYLFIYTFSRLFPLYLSHKHIFYDFFLVPSLHSSLCLLSSAPSLPFCGFFSLPSFIFISFTHFLPSHSPVIPSFHFYLMFPFLHLVHSFPFLIFLSFSFPSPSICFGSFSFHPYSSFISDPSRAPLSPSHASTQPHKIKHKNH